jgi:hypothetical protein
MTDVIKQHLVRAQHRMKVQTDKRRSDISFQVGDKVFLKLQPYVQSSLARRAHQKLAFKFFGPYQITENNGLSVGFTSRQHHPPGVPCIPAEKMLTPSLNVSPTLPDSLLLSSRYQRKYWTLA